MNGRAVRPPFMRCSAEGDWLAKASPAPAQSAAPASGVTVNRPKPVGPKPAPILRDSFILPLSCATTRHAISERGCAGRVGGALPHVPTRAQPVTPLVEMPVSGPLMRWQVSRLADVRFPCRSARLPGPYGASGIGRPLRSRSRGRLRLRLDLAIRPCHIPFSPVTRQAPANPSCAQLNCESSKDAAP